MIQRETEEIRISMDDLARAKVKRRGREERGHVLSFLYLLILAVCSLVRSLWNVSRKPLIGEGWVP